MKSKTHRIFGEEVEWLSQDSGVTIDILREVVLGIIEAESFDIYEVNKSYLPFDNRSVHKRMTNFGVKMNPVKYLDVIEIPECFIPYQENT